MTLRPLCRHWPAALLLLALCLAAGAPAAIAADTSSIAALPCALDRGERSIWPTLARLGDNAFALLTVNSRRDAGRRDDFLRLDLIDSIGDCLADAVVLRPESPGIAWQPGGLTEVHATSSTTIVVPALGRRRDSAGVERVEGYIFTAPADELSAVRTFRVIDIADTGGVNLPPVDLRAGICDDGLVRLVSLGQQSDPPYHNKLLTRAFRSDDGTLQTVAIRDPLPAGMYDPATRSDNRAVGPTPVIGAFDDGTSVAAWVTRVKSRAHICYALLNSRLSLERAVAVADCDVPDPFVDSAPCITGNVHTVALDIAPNGRFCLVWSNIDPVPPTHHTRTHLWMRWFDRGGDPLTGVIRVDDADSTNIVNQQQLYPVVTIGPSGTAVVVWSDARHHPTSSATALRSDVFVQFVSPSGKRLGDNIMVSKGSGFDGLKGTHFDAAWIDGDRCLLVWRNFEPAATGQLRLRRVSVPD
jgi:hypothetical protein